MGVQIDTNAGPIQPCCNLFDMGRFAGTVVPLDHDAPVERKAGQDSERGVPVKAIARVDFRHMVACPRKCWCIRHKALAYADDGSFEANVKFLITVAMSAFRPSFFSSSATFSR